MCIPSVDQVNKKPQPRGFCWVIWMKSIQPEGPPQLPSHMGRHQRDKAEIMKKAVSRAQKWSCRPNSHVDFWIPSHLCAHSNSILSIPSNNWKGKGGWLSLHREHGSCLGETITQDPMQWWVEPETPVSFSLHQEGWCGRTKNKQTKMAKGKMMHTLGPYMHSPSGHALTLPRSTTKRFPYSLNSLSLVSAHFNLKSSDKVMLLWRQILQTKNKSVKMTRSGLLSLYFNPGLSQPCPPELHLVGVQVNI